MVVYGKLLRVQKVESDDAFMLTLKRLSNGKVGYTWRSVTDEAVSGEGELFEKYEDVVKLPSGTHVKDVGSRLGIELQGLSLEWSSSSDDSGYIYYNPRRVTLAYQ